MAELKAPKFILYIENKGEDKNKSQVTEMQATALGQNYCQ
jgi:hypothetical protein